MTETAQFEAAESMADPIVQVSQVSVTVSKPQQSAQMEDHVEVTETKHTSKKHEVQDSMLNKDAVKVQETSRTGKLGIDAIQFTYCDHLEVARFKPNWSLNLFFSSKK